MGAHGLAQQREAGRLALHTQRDHCSRVAGLLQSCNRAARGVGIGHHDRRERVARRGRERGLPTGLDLDQLEQCAHHAVEIGQSLGSGASPRLVEGERERVGARRPRLAVGLRAPPMRLDARHVGLGRPMPSLGFVDRGDERLLGSCRILELGAKACGIGVETLRALVQGGEPALEPGRLGAAAIDRGAHRRELASHLRGGADTRVDAVGPLALDLGPLRQQRLLGRGQLVGLRRARLAGQVDLAELVRQRARLGLERGDQVAVHCDRAVALDRAGSLRQERGQAPSAFAERLQPADRIAETGGIGGRQRRLSSHDRRVEMRERGLQFGLARRERRARLRAVLRTRAQRRDLASREMQAQRRQLGDEVTVAAGRVGLSLERAQLTPHLAQQVLQTEKVAFGGLEPALGLLFAAPVLQHTRGFLDDHAPVLGPGVEHGVELALRHDHVLLATDAAVGEQFLHVEQPARHAVDRVLALTRRTEQRARDRHLGELDREDARGVVDGQRHLRPPERGALRASGEDDVLHLRRSHRARSLGTEHPRHRVDDVGLAAAIGPDHHGDARLELERGGLGKRLEPLQGEGFQEHAGEASGGSGGVRGFPPRCTPARLHT